MDFILFFVFGVIETYCIFALMFKLFSIPYFEYLKEISILAVMATASSFLIRNVLEMPIFIDMVASAIYVILFLRFLIKIKSIRSVVISSVYAIYALINIGIFFVYTKTGIVDVNEAVQNSSSVSAYIVQLSSSLFSLLIALFVYHKNIGFNFIIRPPHNLFIKSKISKAEIKLLSIISLVVMLGFSMMFLLSHNKTFIGYPVYVCVCLTLLYMAYKRDLMGDEDD